MRIPYPPEIEAEGFAIVQAADGREIVLLKSDRQLRAIDRLCPHEDGDLSEGLMVGAHLKCPAHGWIFDLSNGRCLNRRGNNAQVYDVEVDGDTVVLRPQP
jgi:nitrite reductase (NADH) small subunit